MPKTIAELKIRQAQLRSEMKALEMVISSQLESTPGIVIPEVLRDAPPSIGGVAKAGLSALTGNAFDGHGNGSDDASAMQKLATSPVGRMLLTALITTISKKVSEGVYHLVGGNGHETN